MCYLSDAAFADVAEAGLFWRNILYIVDTQMASPSYVIVHVA